MRSYYDLAIETRIYTSCCGAWALAADGTPRKKPRQVVEGEPLTCEACGKPAELVEEEEAWENEEW